MFHTRVVEYGSVWAAVIAKSIDPYLCIVYMKLDYTELLTGLAWIENLKYYSLMDTRTLCLKAPCVNIHILTVITQH